jgi:dihydrofolate synthase/folylpolyglutamate synthase
MYQRVGTAAYKADLNSTLLLTDYLKQPQHSFKSVHVAGTNGKGSTSHMIASVFQEAGYKTGLYTSPHLKDFRERIKINGEMIPRESVCRFVNEHRTFFELHRLSFFEMTVGLAFDHFRSEEVDIAIVEVGMGGRLDSTNIITPEISVITNIGMDHTQFLGNSREEIAREKAGIIKNNTAVVVGEDHPETRPVFEDMAASNKAELHFSETLDTVGYTTDLKGNYQNQNLRTVLKTIEILKNMGWILPLTAIKKGLENVIPNTGLMGRWQELHTNPKIICDTAHNREGLNYVLNQLQREKYTNLHIVLGMVNDKDLGKILDLFPEDAVYYFCQPDIPRALDAEVLKQKATQFNLSGQAYKSVTDAYKVAVRSAIETDLIFVGGSTFVVAEVL